MNKYNFTITLRPWGDNPETGIVEIDPAALYGYWEHRDGSEGGGLWFEPECGKPTATATGVIAGSNLKNGKLELIDFDGAAALPLKVVNALRAAGVTVEPEFEL